jgi:Integral membrane protein S linking to the trans Golgi network
MVIGISIYHHSSPYVQSLWLDINLSVLYLVLIVRRSQLILDFVLTLQFFHLLFTIWYNWHFPVGWLWWGTKGAETAIMIVGGVYFCRMRELKPIEFGVYEMLPTHPQQEDIERQNQDDQEDRA